MSYNHMSQQFHSTQNSRNRKKEDVNDALMRLVSQKLNPGATPTTLLLANETLYI